MITMTHRERQKVGRLLAIKLLNKHAPKDAPEWKQVRDLLGASNESKPRSAKSHKTKGTRKKQRETIARRKKEYPKLIKEGYNNVQMGKILKTSRSSVSHDLMRLGLRAHQHYHWRATNTVTKKTGFYINVSSLQADTKIVKALWRVDKRAVVGPWIVERGCWYQDSHGNWYEAPK